MKENNCNCITYLVSFGLLSIYWVNLNMKSDMFRISLKRDYFTCIWLKESLKRDYFTYIWLVPFIELG